MTATDAKHDIRAGNRKRYKQVQGSKEMKKRKREKMPEKNHSARQGILRRARRIKMGEIKTNRSIMKRGHT